MSDEYRQGITDYYSKEIQKTSDLKFSCCITKGGKQKQHAILLSKISPEVIEKYYGCGTPIPNALEGKVLLDLGCGTGRDCFLVSALAGKNGHIIGVDMTNEQLEVANRAISYHQKEFPHGSPIEFKQGLIEDLKAIGINDKSIDVVISNCVVNLSNDKQSVFNEIYRVLKDGGEVHISDVFTNKDVGDAARANPMLVGECMGNALDLQTFVNLMKTAGFTNIYPIEARFIPTPGRPDDILDPSVDFFSVTFSAFKFSSPFDDKWNGIWCKYLGGIDSTENGFEFDMFHTFKINEKTFIGTLMKEVLSQSRYGKFFEFGRDETHIPPPPEKQDFIQTVLNTKPKEEEIPQNGQCYCIGSSCCCNCQNPS